MSLYKRKRSPYWWAKVCVPGRKPVQQSTRTADKQKAREFEARLAASLWEQSKLGVKPKYTWQEAVVRYAEESGHNASFKSDVFHLNWLRPHLDGKFLNEIDRALLDRVTVIRRRANVSNATVNRCMQVVSRILRRAALDWEWIDRAPKVRSLPEPPIRIRFLTQDEAGRLIAELPPHLVPMVRFSLATGLRKSNVTGLQWSEVDLVNRRAWIHADESKSGRAIGIPLSLEAVEVLRLELFKHPTHVFTYKGKSVGQVNGKAWKAALSRAGIANFRWHDLRHTWASWHRQNGTPDHVLMELGGWSSLEMLRKYAHLSVNHTAAYVEGASLRSVGLENSVATN